jgi:hypothetical protein
MPTFTLAELEDAVWGLLERNTQMFPERQVRNALNEALRVTNAITGYWQESAVVPGGSVAGQYLYDVPAPIVVPMAVLVDGVRLHRYTFPNLLLAYPEYARETTRTMRCPVAEWCPMGLRRLIIHPAEARTGRTIEVRGVAEMTPLAAPGDPVTLEDEWVPTILRYAAHVLQFKIGGQIFAQAAQHYKSFLSEMKIRKAWQAMKMPQFFLQAAQPDPAKLSAGQS